MMERELLLLGLLRQGKTHGYQLNEFIERDMGHFINLKKPTAYALLDRMEKQGWITQVRTQEGNRPPRHTFTITEDGERRYQELLRDNLSAFADSFFAGDVGLTFIHDVPPREAVELLEKRRSGLLEELATMRDVPQHEGGSQLAIDHRRVHLESELRWLEALIERFRQL
jgi:DNA-binding PadR family transcriptional regulator